MKKFYMGRIVCLNHHCLLALLVESSVPNEAAVMDSVYRDIQARFAGLVDSGTMQRRCGVCASVELQAEAGVLFNCPTMERAEQLIAESHAGITFRQYHNRN